MASGNNKFEAWNYGNREDLAVSYEDYFDIIDNLLDERLSKKMLMKFKNLYEMNMVGALATPIFAVPPTYLIYRFLMASTKRSHSGYRYTIPLFCFIWPMCTMPLCTMPRPRRLYTEIFTDETDDGTYIRSTIKEKQPGVWRKISAQLHQKGYDFPEINENHNNTEFPKDFVTRY